MGKKLYDGELCSRRKVFSKGLGLEKQREFPGNPVAGTLHFHCRGPGFDPWLGMKIPQAAQRGQKKKSRRGRNLWNRRV